MHRHPIIRQNTKRKGRGRQGLIWAKITFFGLSHGCKESEGVQESVCKCEQDPIFSQRVLHQDGQKMSNRIDPIHCITQSTTTMPILSVVHPYPLNECERGNQNIPFSHSLKYQKLTRTSTEGRQETNSHQLRSIYHAAAPFLVV